MACTRCGAPVVPGATICAACATSFRPVARHARRALTALAVPVFGLLVLLVSLRVVERLPAAGLVAVYGALAAATAVAVVALARARQAVPPAGAGGGGLAVAGAFAAIAAGSFAMAALAAVMGAIDVLGFEAFVVYGWVLGLVALGATLTAAVVGLSRAAVATGRPAPVASGVGLATGAAGTALSATALAVGAAVLAFWLVTAVALLATWIACLVLVGRVAAGPSAPRVAPLPSTSAAA